MRSITCFLDALPATTLPMLNFRKQGGEVWALIAGLLTVHMTPLARLVVGNPHYELDYHPSRKVLSNSVIAKSHKP